MQMGRLIVDGPLSGRENMETDSRLLDETGKSGVPVLRFYQWTRPTLSLGYFQKLEQVSPLSLPDQKIDLCRRPTGGGAILHHLELTFSLCLPQGHGLAQGRVEGSYLKICNPVLQWCRQLGLEAEWRGDTGNLKAGANCFAGRACPDIVVEGKKIFGAAQRRRGGAVMTHGSLLLGLDWQLWRAVFGEHLESGFACVNDWVQAPEPAVLASRLTASWGSQAGVDWKSSDLKTPKAVVA